MASPIAMGNGRSKVQDASCSFEDDGEDEPVALRRTAPEVPLPPVRQPNPPGPRWLAPLTAPLTAPPVDVPRPAANGARAEGTRGAEGVAAANGARAEGVEPAAGARAEGARGAEGVAAAAVPRLARRASETFRRSLSRLPSMRRRDPADLGTYYRQVAERLVPESTVNRAAKLRLYRPGHHATTNPPLEDGEATSGALRLLVNKFRGELEYDLDMVGDYRNLGLFLVYFLLLLTVLALQRQVGVGPLRRQYASV